MNNATKLIGREQQLFEDDVCACEEELSEIISRSSFLVIGAAGSIGQAVTKEIFKRDPSKLHVVDVSENNMVELVRDIRSSLGYGSGDLSLQNVTPNTVVNDKETYIHRIGRSGRYGRKGVAINFINDREISYMKHIEEFYDTKINEMPQNIADYLN